MDFNKMFLEAGVEDSVKKVDYDCPIFEAPDSLKGEISELIEGDINLMELKTKAIEDMNMVKDYLDYIHGSYEKQIIALSEIFNIGFDDVANTFMEI